MTGQLTDAARAERRRIICQRLAELDAAHPPARDDDDDWPDEDEFRR